MDNAELRIENENYHSSLTTHTSQLTLFCDLLLSYNKIHNVSGVKTKEDILRYVEDSIYPKEFLKEHQYILDIGSGAGFPGLIIALFYPEKKVTLLEPIKKKSAFLHLATSKLRLKNVHIISKRVEECESFFVDLIVSRAVTDTKVLLDLSKKFINDKTKFLLYKGSNASKELDNIKYDMIRNGDRRYIYINRI